ncbi:pseudouridine synthase [uncultured Cohaesibacter sp.]|uniref:pseudouridine synthase n=1 Tax=uncultured Cohaesibacter sp. TaxID=1002546 RepID=UPI002AAAA7B9|nr:pseudouridine synthase [uncultured Cohaesibacter sp.]
MERKSAQNGPRSADATSPEGSENARRDGAHRNKSASGSFKGGMRKGGSNKFGDKFAGKSGGKFSGKKGFGKKRDDRSADRKEGWSPSVDARRETPQERSLRQNGDRPDRSERSDRPARKDRGDWNNRGDRNERRSDDRRGNGPKREGGFDKGRRSAGGGTGGFKGKSYASSPRMSGQKFSKPSDNRPKGPAYTPPTRALEEGERIAKIMARAGLCSRRDAETWIKEGRVSVNGKVLDTPAVNIHTKDKVLVDGAPLPVRERTRLWLYHKPKGLVTTTSDPEGRPTVFEKLPQGLPRVITVGRLDINTEGLLLLTNDGGLARVLELPTTGWLRRYRVRAYGRVTQAQLDTLADGIALEGVLYGSIDAQLEREVGDNVWITVALREGKNREVKKVLGHLGLDVNRLIRVSYGPFQLLDLDEGKVQEVRGRILRDQLGERLVEESGADFDAPILTEVPKEEPKQDKKDDRKKSGGAKGGYLSAKEGARVIAGQKGAKKRFDDDDRGDRRGRPERGDRRDRRDGDDRGYDRRDKPSYNAIPYAERKPFDPSAPRRTNYVYREEGADGKKTGERSVRKVGGRPQKADLMDPNARIAKKGGKKADSGKFAGKRGGKFGNGPSQGRSDNRFGGRSDDRSGGKFADRSGGRGGFKGGKPRGGGSDRGSR